MACYFYTGSRGSGKTLGSVHQIYEYLKSGRPVATNLDINPKKLIDKGFNLTRLPDKPSSIHMHELGHAYIDDTTKSFTYDESKNGLIVLDEISLFLSSKRDKEFQPLMEWLVQSRKWGWDLILIAQSKEQVNETVYKALCDNLVLCKADKLVPIPYIGGLMRKIGFSGKLPDNHTALVLNGRSEQNGVIETISYSRKKLQNMYNTAQTFTDGLEYVNGELRDMRSSYRVVPDYILTGQKLIDGFNEQINIVKNKVKLAGKQKEEGKKMAIDHHKSTGNYIKIGLLALGLVVFLVLNNPLDNPMLSGVTGTADDPSHENIAEVKNNIKPVPVVQDINDLPINTDIYNGVFENMIKGAELSIPVHSENNGLSAIVQITTETQKSFISLADLRVLGWYAMKTENVIFLKKGKTTIQVPLSLTNYAINQ